MDETEIKYFKLSSFPKIQEAFKEAENYAKLSAAYTYPRTISEPYNAKSYWKKMMRNIFNGKIPEFLVKQHLRSLGVKVDLDEGRTPYYTEDYFDLSLIIDGQHEEWDVKNLTLFNSFELSDWKHLYALIPVKLSKTSEVIACQEFNKIRRIKGKNGCKYQADCEVSNKCILSGQWYLRNQPVRYQSKRYLITFSHINSDFQIPLSDAQFDEYKGLYEEYKNFERSIPSDDKYNPKKKIDYMIKNFKPSTVPYKIKSIHFTDIQLEGTFLIAGVADDTIYDQFRVSIPPNIMRSDGTLLHYTTIPNMRLPISKLRPLSRFL